MRKHPKQQSGFRGRLAQGHPSPEPGARRRRPPPTRVSARAPDRGRIFGPRRHINAQTGGAPRAQTPGRAATGLSRVATKPPTPTPRRSGVSARRRGGAAWGCSRTAGERGAERVQESPEAWPPALPRSQRPPPARGASHRRRRLLRAALRVLQCDHGSAAVVAAARQGLLGPSRK